MFETSFSIPPMRARVDIPTIVDPKHDHADVSFRHSPLVLKLKAAHPQYERLLHLLADAAERQSAVKYLYSLFDDTLVFAADSESQELESTTISALLTITG